MKTTKKETRQHAIEAAAYEVLKEKGYKATSMLAIAKQASASNETLYKWYGNKQVLFAQLIKQNAAQAKTVLTQCLQNDLPSMESLHSFGMALLKLLSSQKVIILNRAAAIDAYETGILGKTIAKCGKEALFPLIIEVLEKAKAQGILHFDDTSQIADIYISLLIGDLQIQRVIGVRGPLEHHQRRKRVDQTCALIVKLFGTNNAKNTPAI